MRARSAEVPGADAQRDLAELEVSLHFVKPSLGVYRPEVLRADGAGWRGL